MENFNYRPNRNYYYPPSRPNFHNRPAFRSPSPRHRFSMPPFHPYNNARAPALTPNALRMFPPHMQPPPMFGPRGSTLPPHLLNNPHNFRPAISTDNREQYTGKTNNSRNNSATYCCETCDRDFKTADILESHKAQHQTCNIDGCKFVAHPKVITKHIQMQHSTGLYKKIAKLDTPEDIQKWIAERKKRYPTKVNIDKKKSELEEKIARGEKMGLNKGRFDHKKGKDMPGNRKNFGKGDNYKNQNRGANYVKNQENRKKNLKKNELNILKAEIKNDEDIFNMNLRAFKGLDEIAKLDLEEESKELPNRNDLKIADEDEPWLQTHTSESINNKNNVSVCSALSALMDTYGSSDDDREENKGEKSNHKQNITRIHANQEKKCHEETFNVVNNKLEITENKLDSTRKIGEKMLNKEDDVGNDSDNSAPEEIKSVSIIPGESSDNIGANDSTKDNIPPRKRQRKHKNAELKETDSSQKDTNKFINTKHETNMRFNKAKTFIRKAPSTLLEKLLGTEIRHERNVVLQCIRHIVQNNFFKNDNE